jgi:hypothetical protein
MRDWFEDLGRALRDPDEARRVDALDGLGKSLSRAKSHDPTQSFHIYVAGEFGQEVVTASRDRSVAVRVKAIEALRFLVPCLDVASEALVEALAAPDAEVREVALRSLQSVEECPRFTAGVEQALPGVMNRGDPETRRAALQFLSRSPREWAALVVSLAREAMKFEEADIRKGAIALLRKTDRAAALIAVPNLIKALGDQTAEVRGEAASTLSWLGPVAVDAVPALVNVLWEGSSKAVCDAAVRALLTIDPEHQLTLDRLAMTPGVATREALTQRLSRGGQRTHGLLIKLKRRWVKEQKVVIFHPNGPGDQGSFWWDNTEYHLAPQPWQLLVALWNKDYISIEEVSETVWESKAPTQWQIKSTLQDLEDVLKRAGVPWRYGRDGDHIKKKTRGG